ncbi:hypothetical protein [Streptomyces violascens]|uniref:hypothetical protein n=1 Tax=Streptomyces violascens TaxID=67381 RepID=UPI003668CFB9
MNEDQGELLIEQRHGAWLVQMWWPHDQLTGGPKKLTVVPAADAPAADIARGLSSTVLRQIDTVSATAHVAEIAPNIGRVREHAEGIAALRRSLRHLLATEGVSDLYLSLLASAYRLFTLQGKRGIVAELAEMTERTPETIKGHLKQARRRGLLTTVAGKAGGELTSKAKEILAQHDAPKGTND